VIGPVLGVFFITFTYWKNIFIFLAISSVFSGIYGYKKIPDTPITTKYSLKDLILMYKEIFLTGEFVKLSVVRGILLALMIIWIVESPFILLSMIKPWEFAVIQVCVFCFFALGEILSLRLLDKLGFFKLVKISFSGIALFAILFMVFAALNYKFCCIIALLPFMLCVAIPMGALERLAIEASNQHMETKVAVYSTIVNMIAAFCIIMLAMIEDKSFASVGISFVIMSFILVVVYFSTQYVKNGDIEHS
jgi:hypothetical protein